MNNNFTKLTLVDFFCGAGGFTEGFKQMGFKSLYGYDHWLPATKTYNHNHDLACQTVNILSFFDSIEAINKVPDSMVILGSPPCVSFSTSNKSGKANKDLGMKLIKSFLRVVAVKKHQPNSILEAWYMENVVNSKNYLKEYYTFEDLNLSDWAKTINKNPDDNALKVSGNTEIINSADYGSHQARKRSISGEVISKDSFIIPKRYHCEKGEILKPWNNLGQILSQLPSPNCEYSEEFIVDPVYPSIRIPNYELSDHFYDSGLYECEWRQSKELKTNHHCMGKMAFPENRDKPSRTVTATKSATSRESLIYKSEFKRKGDGEFRSPTIREISSLMGFPITYQFTGNLYTKWRQIGNAVCPSVSRALAREFIKQNNYQFPAKLHLVKKVNLQGIINLNTYQENKFDNPPKRTKGSKYRRHPIKEGNITVTLSNFDIILKNKPCGKWYTSIQYGTGAKFKHQVIDDKFYEILEVLIKTNIKEGEKFIKIINNGFSEKIATSDLLQKMYEHQKCEGIKMEPTILMDNLKDIIYSIDIEDELFTQNYDSVIFEHKEKVPMRQVLALYGVNKIATLANKNDCKNLEQFI